MQFVARNVAKEKLIPLLQLLRETLQEKFNRAFILLNEKQNTFFMRAKNLKDFFPTGVKTTQQPEIFSFKFKIWTVVNVYSLRFAKHSNIVRDPCFPLIFNSFNCSKTRIYVYLRHVNYYPDYLAVANVLEIRAV